MKKQPLPISYKFYFLHYFFCLLILTESCQNIENEWLKTRVANNKESFEKFIMKNPASAYTDSANILLFDLYKLDTKSKNTIDDYNMIAKRFKSTSIADSAKLFAIEMAFQIMLKDTTLESHKVFVNSFFPMDSISLIESEKKDIKELKRFYAIKAYEGIIKQYPNLPLKDEATIKIIELSWEETLSINTIEAFQKFILDYPNSEFSNKAVEGLYALKAEYSGTISSCKLASMLGDGNSNEFTGFLTTTFKFKLIEYPKITFFMKNWSDGYRLLSIKSNAGINISEKCKGIKIHLTTNKSKSLDKLITKFAKLY